MICVFGEDTRRWSPPYSDRDGQKLFYNKLEWEPHSCALGGTVGIPDDRKAILNSVHTKEIDQQEEGSPNASDVNNGSAVPEHNPNS